MEGSEDRIAAVICRSSYPIYKFHKRCQYNNYLVPVIFLLQLYLNKTNAVIFLQQYPSSFLISNQFLLNVVSVYVETNPFMKLENDRNNIVCKE